MNGKLHSMPMEKPSYNRIRDSYQQREREEMDLIAKCFRDGTLAGKLVCNWCANCGKWRLQYVSQARLNDGVSLDETFECVHCKHKMLLIIDGEHTLLEARPKPETATEDEVPF